MTDPLPPCWSCPFCDGKLEITKHFREPIWQGIHRCPVVGAITFDWRGSEQEIIDAWNARALGPALDVVLEAVERQDMRFWNSMRVMREMESIGNPLLDSAAFERHRFVAMLRALRDAHSPTDTPSGSGAKSGGGEAERGS